MSLKGKTILAFGAGVLGEGYTRLFKREGANLAIAGINGTGTKLAHELNTTEISDSRAIGLEIDVTSQSEVRKAYEMTQKEFGKIDVVINGAGGNLPSATVNSIEDFLNMDAKDMKAVVDLNFWSKVYSMQSYLDHLIKNDHQGRVVNITSMSGIKPISRVMYYGTAFAAAENFLSSVALLYGETNRGQVNNVAFGFTVSDQNRNLLINVDGSLTKRGKEIIDNTCMHKFLESNDLAYNVLNLADKDRSPGVHGATLRVDGGYDIVGLSASAGYLNRK